MDTIFGRTLPVRNVNYALPRVCQLLSLNGVRVTSRGMETVELPGPFMTIYEHPTERMLFDPVRDANPVFHLVDALWLLSGSKKLDLPAKFLPRYRDFSDDGRTLHGAYGYRIRKHFGRDQLFDTAELLRCKRDTRQAVISIWDPAADLATETKDMPCNDMVMFSIREGRLHMTVNNRSNDAIWGAYGANAVQFSVLQEVMAALTDTVVGYYAQVSNSMHAYTNNPFWQKGSFETMVACPYTTDPLLDVGLELTSVQAAEAFVRDCERLANRVEAGLPYTRAFDYETKFFKRTVCIALQAHASYRDGNLEEALDVAAQIAAPDIHLACYAWFARRKVAAA